MRRCSVCGREVGDELVSGGVRFVSSRLSNGYGCGLHSTACSYCSPAL